MIFAFHLGVTEWLLIGTILLVLLGCLLLVIFGDHGQVKEFRKRLPYYLLVALILLVLLVGIILLNEFIVPSLQKINGQ